jgi:hypothetical protein
MSKCNSTNAKLVEAHEIEMKGRLPYMEEWRRKRGLFTIIVNVA